MNSSKNAQGFTLIELLTVISIIAVLMGLLFSAMGGVKDSGNKTKAKNDLVQIVNAVKTYYAEYGKYPLLPTETGDTTFGENDPKTAELMNVFRANSKGRDDPTKDNLNPRRVIFLDWPIAKDLTAPKSGIGSDYQPYDPWGRVYLVKVDGDYDNKVGNPYTSNAGLVGYSYVDTGVIAWSLGKNGKGGTGDKKSADSEDDVISWQ